MFNQHSPTTVSAAELQRQRAAVLRQLVRMLRKKKKSPKPAAQG